MVKLFKNLIRFFAGIRVKIMSAIFIPILLMGVFGIICYAKISNAITTNYEKSTAETINAVGNYLDLGLKSVQNKSMELLFSNSVTDYYAHAKEKDSLDDINNYNNLEEDMIVVQTMNPFIGSMTIFGENGRGISTSQSGNIRNNQIYMDYIDSEEAQIINDTNSKDLWVGQHSSLDQLLGESGYSYAASFIKTMNDKNGYLVIDISMETIQSCLDDINFGDGSIIGFVTGDGKEILSNTDETTVFYGSDFYQKITSSDKMKDYSYENYHGKKYLFTYSKIGDTGFVICSLIPKSTILKQADNIKHLIVFFVFFASIIAIIVGTFIAGGIGNAIIKLKESILKVSSGDLTINFETRRKDEFLILSNSLNEMLGDMRGLIGEVASVGSKVNDSARQLSSTAETILEDTKDISLTIDEIESGIVHQADDTQNCSDQMSNLSEKIGQLYVSTDEIEQIANDTKLVVRNGITIVDELKLKANDTSNITQVIINEIKALEKQSHSIGDFVGIIHEIASQTNLLSLNASIEAARAGHAGQGFAVVAEEIRKLADETVKAAHEIEGIVSQIKGKTKNTVVTAVKAENIVKSHTEALYNTIDLFEVIDKHVHDLTGNLNAISMGIKGIETAKEDTVDAISNISAVSEETAASAEEVSATANNQIHSVEKLSQSASCLAGNAQQLQDAVKVFRI